jgi:hypothetical protein
MPERDGKAPRGLPIVGLTAGSRTGLHRDTIRRAITSDEPPTMSRRSTRARGAVEARCGQGADRTAAA